MIEEKKKKIEKMGGQEKSDSPFVILLSFLRRG